MTLELFGHPFSSYTWKALIALYANDMPFTFRSFTPGDQADADYLQRVHPAGKFPVLTDGDSTVIETTAIIEHLAVRHPGPAPLIPADPAAAVTTRMLDRIFDNYVMGNAQRVVSAYIVDKDYPDPGEVDGGRQGLLQAYRWLETWLSENPLPPHVSLVTCAAAPSLFYADWVERIPADCSRLSALRAELLALPAVSRCVEEARPYRPFFPLGAPDRD